MFPRRPRQIFISRWSALAWACGVIFFAVTTIGSGGDGTTPPANQTAPVDPSASDARGPAVANDDMAVLRKFAGGN